MTTLKDSNHFASAGDIPEITADTPLREVYAQLNRAGRGGFIVSIPDGSRKYVKAYALAEAAILQAGGDVGKIRLLADRPIGQHVLRVIDSSAVIPVDEHPVDVRTDEKPLRDQDARVFLLTESDHFTGWYLNHEAVSDTRTQKTVYVCQNGHGNPDPDRGTCYLCPFPITGTRRS
jgi:hypothetical protein